MKQLFLIAFSAMISSVGCASATPPPENSSFVVGQDVNIAITDHVTTYEMWNFAPSRLIPKGDVVVSLNVLDVEAAPIEAGKQLLAVVLVGEYGTGVEPVAFRVSAPDSRIVEIVPRSGETAPAIFDLSVGNEKPVPLVVEPDGRVTLAEHPLGVIK